MIRALPAPLRLPSIRPYLLEAAIVLWAVVTAPIAVHLALAGARPLALLALAAGPAAWWLRRRRVLAAVVLVVGATILRLAFVGLSTSDPIELSQMAAARALRGQDPYGGFVYQNAAVTPYAYGPLGLITYQLGIPAELLSTIATSALLIWARAWLTMAFFNAWPQLLLTSAIGNNDYSVGFVMLAAIVLLRSRPRLGMALLAVAISTKPYAAAWLIPAIGYVGLGVAAAIGIGLSVVLWSPVLFVWGVPSFLQSVRAVETLRSGPIPSPSWTFADAPVLRLLVVPLSLAGLVLHSWRAMALLGSAGFLAFLGFSPWAHHAYLGALVPILGLALEEPPPDKQGSLGDVPDAQTGERNIEIGALPHEADADGTNPRRGA